ncbi:MAG: hydroxyacylglutathione hydrolase [Pseudomonadota bacterium]
MALDVIQIPCLSDNYGYLIRDRDTGETATIDTPDAEAINNTLAAKSWRLDYILNTHHHWDHTGGNLSLKEHWGCTIIGPRAEAARIPGIDRAVGEGDTVSIGESQASVFDTPGHTAGHIIYFFAEDVLAFVGDTIFALGCGRLFEGKPAEMLASLNKIAALPPETKLFCAHEYTEANAAFAITVDPENATLKQRHAEIEAKRANGMPTVPSTLAEELATNPFLRSDAESLRRTLDMQSATAVEVFTETRQRKDSF